MTLKLARRPGGDPFAEQTAGQAFVDALRDGDRGVEVRTLVTTAVADSATNGFAGADVPDGPSPRRRPVYVQDLIPHTPTGNNRVPYLRRLTPLTIDQQAAMTAEGTAKTEVAMGYEGADAFVRKVSAWVPMTTEIRDDAEALAATVDEDLAAQLDWREQDAILNGNGTAPNLLGIRQTTGLLTVKAAGGTKTSVVGDTATNIALGLQILEDNEMRGTGVLMHPDDFWPMVTKRAGGGATGDNHFDTDPLEDAEDWRAWRVPILRTLSVPAGTALVGDFTRGARIRDREETVVRLGDQHDVYFTTGKVAVVAEKRLALEVKVPAAFVEVTFR